MASQRGREDPPNRRSGSQCVEMTGASPPPLRVVAPSASPEEAAAIVAALERFMRATAPLPSAAAAPHAANGWRRRALLEGTEREPTGSDLPDPWINT
jgi:hypothetical protein